jgi:hypothetical protein
MNAKSAAIRCSVHENEPYASTGCFACRPAATSRPQAKPTAKLTSKQVEALRKVAAHGGTDFQYYWSSGSHRVEINGNCATALVRLGLITSRLSRPGEEFGQYASITAAGRAALKAL